jgi:hypothetical protein
LIQYNVRSTYRFLLKTRDLHFFQRYILNFLRKLNATMTDEELITRFKRLRQNLIPLTENQYEKRSFIYFDIISWLEAKIENRIVKDIISEKAMRRESESMATLNDI